MGLQSQKNSQLYFFTMTATIILILTSCKKQDIVPIPQSVEFEQQLSDYALYEGNMSDLKPSTDAHFYELSSILFSNYAEKQRLVRIPDGTVVTENGNGVPVFPEGTILVKTFFYYYNASDTAQGKQIIETRLLIKGGGEWNVASYEWNADQSDAILRKDGQDKQVSWIDKQGNSRTIDYRIPSQRECVKCHQNNDQLAPLGPQLRNLNKMVTRDGQNINQLDHLQTIGILNNFDFSSISSIPDYQNTNLSISERGRAYLDLNCASCHHPNGLSEAAKKGYDFRFETALDDTKIVTKKNKIIEVMEDGRMPDVGTTIIDEEGLAIIIEYMNSL